MARKKNTGFHNKKSFNPVIGKRLFKPIISGKVEFETVSSTRILDNFNKKILEKAFNF